MAKILVVDDYAQLSAVLKAFLVHAEHDVVIAEDGAKGMELFAAGFYDLVITDIWMPNLDGVEFIAKIKNLRTNTKVLAISGAKGGDASARLKEARKAGADATLEKPFGRAELFAAVDGLLGPAS